MAIHKWLSTHIEKLGEFCIGDLVFIVTAEVEPDEVTVKVEGYSLVNNCVLKPARKLI